MTQQRPPLVYLDFDQCTRYGLPYFGEIVSRIAWGVRTGLVLESKSYRPDDAEHFRSFGPVFAAWRDGFSYAAGPGWFRAAAANVEQPSGLTICPLCDNGIDVDGEHCEHCDGFGLLPWAIGHEERGKAVQP